VLSSDMEKLLGLLRRPTGSVPAVTVLRQ